MRSAGREPVLCFPAAELGGDGFGSRMAAGTGRQAWDSQVGNGFFFLKGLPAAVFSLVILKMLPDGPAGGGGWLTTEEKCAWLEGQLTKADYEKAHLGHSAGVDVYAA